MSGIYACNTTADTIGGILVVAICFAPLVLIILAEILSDRRRR